MHNSGITQARATGTLTEIAVRNGVDVATNNALMLAKGTSDIQIEQARELSKLKIEETQSLEQVRLDSYQQEVGIDLKAVLAQRLMVHETVLGIKTRLRNLIIEREEITAVRL